MKKVYLLSLTLFLISSIGFGQLTWEVSTIISPVSSYRGATAIYSWNPYWMFVFGGWTTSSGDFNEMSIYDFEEDIWTVGPIVPENTRGGSAIFSQGYIYLLTGNDGADNNINSQIFLRFDVLSVIWDYVADYPIAARYVAMTHNPNNGLIYCAGGSGDNYSAIDQVNVYNSWDDSWTSCTSLPYPSSGGSALICNGQHLYLMGGLINQPYDKVFKGLIDHNDPTIITWLPGASMPVEMPKISAGYVGNGQILATDLDGTFIYDISTDSWSEVENKPIPVKGGNFVSIPIDGVYNFTVAGGKDINDNIVDHVEYISGEVDIKFPATFVLTSATGEAVENAEIQVSTFTFQTDEAGCAIQFFENGTYDYTAHYNDLVANGSFTIDSASVYIENQLLVSIKEIKDQFSIFPNPSQGKFKISSATEEINSLSILDLNGNPVFLLTRNLMGSLNFDLSHLNKGIYFIVLSNSNNDKTIKKLVIN